MSETKQKVTKQKVHSPNYIYIDVFNNVILQSNFTIVLGKVDTTYRFVPKSNLVLEQGLTPQMLMVIAELIKEKTEIEERQKDGVIKQ